MLTLPVSRLSNLLSKLTVSIIWLNFMAVTALVIVVIQFIEIPWFTNYSQTGTHIWVRPSDLFYAFFTYVLANLFALFIMSVIYFGITLANSVFGRLRIGGLAAGVISVFYLGLHFFVLTRVYIILNNTLNRSTSFGGNQQLMNYIYLFAFSAPILIFTITTISITVYLLKYKVSLQ